MEKVPCRQKRKKFAVNEENVILVRNPECETILLNNNGFISEPIKLRPQFITKPLV